MKARVSTSIRKGEVASLQLHGFRAARDAAEQVEDEDMGQEGEGQGQEVLGGDPRSPRGMPRVVDMQRGSAEIRQAMARGDHQGAPLREVAEERQQCVEVGLGRLRVIDEHAGIRRDVGKGACQGRSPRKGRESRGERVRPRRTFGPELRERGLEGVRARDVAEREETGAGPGTRPGVQVA
ncbi:hypothetical protein D3C72_1723700 [compost metagenome]